MLRSQEEFIMARIFNGSRSAAAVGVTALIAAFAVVQAQQPPAQQPPPQQEQKPPQQEQKPPQGQPEGQRQGAPGQRGAPPPGTPPKPLVPVAASTVAANPDPYYGEYVTMTASVDQILSRTAFVVDQDATKSTGKDVLVVVPTMNGKVDQNAYVTVIGEVVKYDPAEIEKKARNYKSDLAPDVQAKWTGKPAVIATSVINSGFIDVAKRLPPPMTAEEETLQKTMKKIQPAFGALRTAVDGSDAEKTAAQTAILKQAFTDTEAFWKSRNKPDAVKWAQDARAQVETVERSAATEKWDVAKTSAGAIGQACQTCHAQYRERFDDGSFRIKTGGQSQ
jgi:cytochrome c556